MPIDEPVSTADILFAAHRILEVHWTRALDSPWRAGGCLQCRGRNGCRQLDWALEIVADAVSVMFQK